MHPNWAQRPYALGCMDITSTPDLTRLTADERHLVDALLGPGRADLSPDERRTAMALTAHPATGVSERLVRDAPPTVPSTGNPDGDVEWLLEGGRSRPGWQRWAACAGTGAAYVHERVDTPACASCPVRRDCLAAGVHAFDLPGVWGGRVSDDRRRLALDLLAAPRPG